jgi:hypothetical protein
MRLAWHGPAVLARVDAATKAAIDVVTEAAADDAGRSPMWVSHRRGYEDAIASEPARRRGSKIVGRFGLTRRRGKRFDFFIERGTPFLRPAADRTFPLLASLIKRGIR